MTPVKLFKETFGVGNSQEYFDPQKFLDGSKEIVLMKNEQRSRIHYSYDTLY